MLDSKLNEKRLNLKKVAQETNKKIEFPMFVKPSNSGSSVGIKKVKNRLELEDAIKYAGQYDTKILIEKGKVKEIGKKDDILPELLSSTTRTCSRVKEVK